MILNWSGDEPFRLCEGRNFQGGGHFHGFRQNRVGHDGLGYNCLGEDWRAGGVCRFDLLHRLDT